VHDFGKYDAQPGAPLIVDFFTETLPGIKAFWVNTERDSNAPG
jgi:hypothetical protein